MAHRVCLNYDPELIAQYVLSDGVTAFSYFTIPVCLVLYSPRLPKTGNPVGDLIIKGGVYLFALFILFCGLDHALSIMDMFEPRYRLRAFNKTIMAFLSFITAALAWPAMHHICKMPSFKEHKEALNTIKELKKALSKKVNS